MPPKSLFLVGLVATFALLAAPAAIADLGVERVDRTSGKPGESVKLTLGCGACAAAGGQEPSSFPVSLVPAAKVPVPYRCGPNALCLPRVRAVPKQAPFTYLGEALPPGGDGDAEKPYPLYVLDFAIPRLPAGTYTYVIYCDLCLKGKWASLITNPTVNRPWRLRVRR
ncbi:MAG TPA: hypothetical protein VLI94_00525 [Solirubrobacterales bacterium]|nr:hypothetical protein [Solirubrobacterales bacterium]